MDIENFIIGKALSYIEEHKAENLNEDDFYTLAKDGFSYGCSEYEKEHPEILEENCDDVMWYDYYLDLGILDGIMSKMSETIKFA